MRNRRTLIKSYARIKPMGADKDGGVRADKGIMGYDADAGVVEIGAEGGGGKNKRYTHFERTVPPDTAQSDVYATVCAPLVAAWVDGYDVDDEAAYYLYEARMGIVWPVDREAGLLIGEESYTGGDGFAGIADRKLAESDIAELGI